ncbi:NAD-dependent epimerase/dehydratase family protein [Nostoc sp. UIC 10890]
MPVLIIGGNGFIGSHLTNFLVAKEQSIRVYNRSHNPYIKPLDEVEYIYGDFNDQDLLKIALKNVDIVYQLVSHTIPSTSNENPIGDVNSNVINTLKFLEICVEASVRKIIFPSSGGTVYGLPKQLPILETHPTEPICSYGITKLTIEKYLYLYNYLHGLDYSILRIANPYGPGQNPTGKLGAITVFLNRILKHLPIQIWGNGEIIRDYLYILDVVQALYNVQNPNLTEKIFNIGSGQGVSLNDLLDTIRKVIENDFKVEYIEGRKVDIPTNVLDITKASTVLQWRPSVQLETGIQETWQWLKTLS